MDYFLFDFSGVQFHYTMSQLIILLFFAIYITLSYVAFKSPSCFQVTFSYKKYIIPIYVKQITKIGIYFIKHFFSKFAYRSTASSHFGKRANPFSTSLSLLILLFFGLTAFVGYSVHYLNDFHTSSHSNLGTRH